MKNLKVVLSVVLVSAAIIVCAVMLHISNENFIEDVFVGSDIEDSVDEYLISQGFVKAPEKSNGVWLVEDFDTSFDTEGKDFKKAVSQIEKSVFDTVFIRSRYFREKDEKLSYKENLEKLSAVISALKEKEKKVYVEASSEFSLPVFEELSGLCDGVIIRPQKKLSAEKLNSILLGINGKLRKKDVKTYVSLSWDYDISKLNKKSVDGVYVFIDESTDLSKLKVWDKAFKISDTDLICGLDLNSSMNKKTAPSFVLEKLYALADLQSLDGRCFSTLKAVEKNYQNSFSAAKKYITDGIVPDIAFRELSITGYDGTTLQTTDFTSEIEIYGSNLFPVYLDDEKISLGEEGSKMISLSLEPGENSFRLKQAGKELTYKVNMTFEGDIIRYVFPMEQIIVHPKEVITVMVVAYSKADITVKVGAREYKAKCETDAQTGYTAFTAKVPMPETAGEVASLGMITVIGSVGDLTVQQKGAMIVCGEEMTTTEPTTQIQNEEDESTTKLQVGNFVPQVSFDEYEKVTTRPTAAAQSNHTAFTGNQMCIITAPYADTRPLVYNDDTYVPTFSTLVEGTIDYVTNESETFDEEENEPVYFYELASGRKVVTKHAQLIPKRDMGINSLSVVSSQSDNGTLKIRLKTGWKVPYAISHTPQNYFSGYGKKYNLSVFNPNYIQIDFYHTGYASGNVDVSGSNVVSAATWTVSEINQTATLTMPLRALGKYYGCSVEYDSNGDMLITVHNRPQALQGSVILLDPGHGGEDPGALGIGGQVKESDVNLAVAYAARDALRARGATVYLTRQGNETLSLDDRKNIASSLEPDLFVSIHSNGSTKSSDIGTSVYYYKGFSQPLATNIYNEMIQVFKNHLYYGRQELYDQLSDGARFYPFSVTRLEDCPSVLIETGYMTNDEECLMLTRSDTHQRFGQAIASGIEKTILN